MQNIVAFFFMNESDWAQEFSEENIKSVFVIQQS